MDIRGQIIFGLGPRALFILSVGIKQTYHVAQQEDIAWRRSCRFRCGHGRGPVSMWTGGDKLPLLASVAIGSTSDVAIAPMMASFPPTGSMALNRVGLRSSVPVESCPTWPKRDFSVTVVEMGAMVPFDMPRTNPNVSSWRAGMTMPISDDVPDST